MVQFLWVLPSVPVVFLLCGWVCFLPIRVSERERKIKELKEFKKIKI